MIPFLVIGMLVLMFIGIPVGFAFADISAATLAIQGKISLIVVTQRLWAAVDSFPMLAIIFFIISGDLMLQGGISARLINFGKALFSWLRGSLALISVVCCAFFGAISGSALATTAAIGSIMYPEMIKEENGYDPVFSATLQAVGGTLGTMIPPSIPLILYASVSNCSISDLFIAIVIPGCVMAVLYLIAAYYYIFKRRLAIRPAVATDAKKKNLRESLSQLGKSFLDAIWAILMPVIVLGGIYTGIFTPTESAVVACFYSALVGFFIYRELTIKKAVQAIINSSIMSAALMLLIGCANLLGWVMTLLKVNDIMMNLFSSFISGKVTFLIVMNIMFLIMGMFMDTPVIILLIVPILYPIAVMYNVDPVHMGVITVINLSLGMVTPPFGTSLFVASNSLNVPLHKMFREVILYCVIAIIGVLCITFIEPLSTVLLSSMG